jgi:hypothetical protein
VSVSQPLSRAAGRVSTGPRAWTFSRAHRAPRRENRDRHPLIFDLHRPKAHALLNWPRGRYANCQSLGDRRTAKLQNIERGDMLVKQKTALRRSS